MKELRLKGVEEFAQVVDLPTPEPILKDPRSNNKELPQLEKTEKSKMTSCLMNMKDQQERTFKMKNQTFFLCYLDTWNIQMI
jgi:hypothetical protein